MTVPVSNSPKEKHTMKTPILAALGFIVITGMGLLAWGVSTSNAEIRLRNLITAKQRDNQSELDNMQKKILQSAEVSSAQMEAIKGIVVGYADARGSNASGTFINAVAEAVPNVPVETFRNLQNIITSSRDAFTQRQKEILDLKREHDDLRTTFPASLICGARPEITVQIVTSSRAEEDFRTGKDDNIKLF